jgi:hypothetical protein
LEESGTPGTTLEAQVLEGTAFSDRTLSPGHSQYSDLSKKVPEFHLGDYKIQMVT